MKQHDAKRLQDEYKSLGLCASPALQFTHCCVWSAVAGLQASGQMGEAAADNILAQPVLSSELDACFVPA